jgi:hypothetical protein
MASVPRRTWRIITSPEHSTVWDGDQLLFDFNFQAMGIDAGECFQLAYKRELKPGQHKKVYFAEHYSVEMAAHAAARQAASPSHVVQPRDGQHLGCPQAAASTSVLRS